MTVLRRASFLIVGAVALAGVTVPADGAAGPTTLAVEGTLRVVAVDTFGQNARADHLYTVVTDDGATIPVALDGEPSANGRFRGELVVTGEVAETLSEKDLLPPAGSTIGEDTRAGRTATAAAEDQTTPLTVASSTVSPATAAATTTPAAHRAYVAVVRNRGSVEESNAKITQLVNGMTSYWVTESAGAVSSFALGDIRRYDSAVAEYPDQSCGLMSPEAVWTEAKEQFPGVLFDEGTHNHLFVAMADECGDAGAAGVALVGTDLSSEGPMTFTLGSVATQVGTHEIGHTFGLGHANLATCPSAGACEYFDLYSTMGLAVGNSGEPFRPPVLGTLYREQLGVLAADETAQVSQAGSDVTYTLASRAAASGLRGILVTDPGTGEVYSLDARTRTDRDAGTFYGSSYGFGAPLPAYPTGVVIERRAPGGEIYLMTQPGALRASGSWAAGTVFAPSPTLRVTVNSSGASANVRVQLSAAAAPVAAAPVAKKISAKTPRITGTVRIGRTLKIKVGSWSPRPSYRYQWYANGKKITKKGTKKSFTLTSRQKGKRITVKVTARKSGYATVSKTSRRTTRTARR